MFDIVEILQNNWTLFLIGQYPHGPWGGLASTLILAALALLLAFPFGLLLAGLLYPFAVYYGTEHFAPWQFGLLLGSLWLLRALTAAARPEWLGEPLPIAASGRDLLVAVVDSRKVETMSKSPGSFSNAISGETCP